MEYKTIGGIESHYSCPSQELGVKILLSIDRELSDEEKSKIAESCDTILKMLRRNTILTDETEIFHTKEEKRQILECFTQPIYVKEIPNEYEGPDSTRPWFIVVTPKGPIKIGWRKRVISIEWEKEVNPISGMQLFPQEDVTRSTQYDNPHYIHAWGYVKCKEYLTKLLS